MVGVNPFAEQYSNCKKLLSPFHSDYFRMLAYLTTEFDENDKRLRLNHARNPVLDVLTAELKATLDVYNILG